jgi:hypothetical protein
MELEDVGKMALVVEPGGKSDLREGPIGDGKLLGRVLEPKTAYVLAHRAPAPSPKCASEVSRVDAIRLRERRKSDALSEGGMDSLTGIPQPLRRHSRRLFRTPAR